MSGRVLPFPIAAAALLVSLRATAAPLTVDIPYDALVGGSANPVVVTGAAPGRLVTLSASQNPGGAASCPASIAPTCLSIGGPVVTLGAAYADATGTATLMVTPPASPAAVLAVQAWHPRSPSGGRLSGVRIVTGHAATSDADADTLAAAFELAIGTDPGSADTDGDGLDDGVDPCPVGELACDEDGDGYIGADDCDDGDPDVSPSGRDLVGDGVDQDCDGSDALASVHRADILAQATWTAVAHENMTWIATGGDLDGDGADELLLGSPYWDSPATNAGLAVLVYGDPAVAGDTTDIHALPGFTGSTSDDLLTDKGQLSAAGDLDGDGFGDLIVGNPNQNRAVPNYSDAGIAAILYGGTTRETGTPALTTMDASFTGTAGAMRLGYGASGLGDVDGDGFDDASFAGVSPAGSSYQTVFLVYGGSTRLTGAQTLAALPKVVGQAGTDTRLGIDRAVAGDDLDGDGLSDVVMGAPNNPGVGRLYVLYGDPVRPSSISTAALSVVTDGSALVSTDYAYTIDRGGDLDGDGYADMLVADPTFQWIGSNSGRLSVLGGGATPWGAASDLADVTVATIDGVEDVGSCSFAMRGTGDLSGDGNDDVAVSTLRWSTPYANTGAVGVFHGPIAGTVRFDAAETRIEGEGGGAYFGFDLTAGDFDGDGWNDLAVTSTGIAAGAGRAYLFLGGAL